MFGFRLTPDFSTRNLPAQRFQRSSLLAWLVALSMLGSGFFGDRTGFAAEPAAINWHSSLEQALTAAGNYNRPVLVVFTAEWSPASAQVRKHVLADPSTAALLAACFEPVLIDVDATPAVATDLGMNQVPGCCIVRADGTVTARFECPTATGRFIATVGRHLQQTGGSTNSALPARDLASAVTVIAEEIEVASDFSTAGSLLADAAATGPTTKSGSVNQIAAKVRGLSDFASTAPALTTSRYASPPPRHPSMLGDSRGVGAPVATAPPTMAPRLTTAETRELDRSTTFAESLQAPVPAMPAAPSSAIASQTDGQAPTADSAAVATSGLAAAVPSTTSATTPRQPAPAPAPSQQLSQQPAWETTQVAGNLGDTSRTQAATAPWSAEPGQFGGEPATDLANATPPAAVGPYPSTRPAAPPVPRAVAAAPSQSTTDFIEPQPAATPKQPVTKPWLAPAPATTVAAAQADAAASRSAWSAAPQPAAAPQPDQMATAEAPAAVASTESRPKPKPSNPVLAALQNPFGMFSKKEPVATEPESAEPADRLATQPSPAKQASQAQYASQTPATPPASEPQTMPLGLEGFCPVSLIETGSWVEGQAQWGARHRGRTYLFGGLEQQQAFLADPDRYAPALSGDDPVVAFDSGETRSGQRQYGVTYQQRIYLFASPESRATFAANPQRYTSRVMLAEQPASTGNTILR